MILPIRPRVLKRYLILAGLGAVAAAGIATMPQAKADAGSYLDSLTTRGLSVYNPSLALATGYRICAMLHVANGNDVAEYLFIHSSWSDVPDLATAQIEVITAAEELCQDQDHRGQSTVSAPVGGTVGGVFQS